MKDYSKLLIDSNGRYSILPPLKIEEIKVGTIMRAKWNNGIHEIVSISDNIVGYDDKSGFKSLSSEDGVFYDFIDVILECFEFVI